MKTNFVLIALAVITFTQEEASSLEGSTQKSSQSPKRLRVIMMSDFPPIGVVKGGNVPNTQKSDPDDMQSMVRFLLYVNEFDVEGLIASAGTFTMQAHKKNILEVLDRYEKVYENLKKHDPDYPTADYLRSVAYEGLSNNHGVSIKWGSKTQPITDIIGEGKDSEASNAIITAADKPDPRPLWIGVWGGPREVSQAIWRVRNDRSEKEFKAFISKLRIFLIAYQDCTHSWLMNEFPDLFIIDSRKTYQGMFGGRDPISNLAWINENIRHNHGPLCDVYPHEGMGCTGVCEGDSPTFLYLVSANRGINNPEDPTQPSWGGQYKRKANTNHYIDGPGSSSISRWRKDCQKEFAERADWCVGHIAESSGATPGSDRATNNRRDGWSRIEAGSFDISGGSLEAHGENLYYVKPNAWTQYDSVDLHTGTITIQMNVANGGPDSAIQVWVGDMKVGALTVTGTGGWNTYQTQFLTLNAPQSGVQIVKLVFVNGNVNMDWFIFSASPQTTPKKTTKSKAASTPAYTRGPTGYKPRIVVLTDISTWETDDHESLIRFVAHADMFEIEGLIISTGYSIKTLTKSPEKDFINIAHGVVNAYEKDLPNLMKRSQQVGHKFDGAKQKIGYWPSPQYLRDRTMFGSLNRGKQFIGDDNDSLGSDLIIKLADDDDPRPLWVTVWGGGNTVAQSIYRVKKDRTAEQFKAFLRKIRIYTITDQDRHYRGEGLDVSAHGWIREQAGNDLLFIWDESAWKAHNGTGRSNWNQYATHIQGHGNLGSQYPKYKYGVEGDTPSFLYLMPTGLNDPEDPTQCSWGGTFKGNANNLWQPAGSCRSYFDRFYPAAFNNFAARMDWAKDGAGNRNPVIILDGGDGISVLTKIPKPGTTVTLDASQTFDPDDDNLKFNWWIQSDAGAYSGNVNISNPGSSIATVNVPSDAAGKSFHVICEVIDNGTHNLSDYRRIVFRPNTTF